MTKKQKIQEAYGLYWKDYGHLADENGFIYQSDLFYPDTEMKKEGVEIEVISVEHKHKWSNIKWRPKSLSGIEANNGWIKIESEDDLPKEDGYGKMYHLVCSGKVENQGRYIHSLKAFCHFGTFVIINHVTHYQPIEKPKPPIY